MSTACRLLLALPLAGALALTVGCPAEPYFTGDGPPINDNGIQPAFENGNVGTALVLNVLVDRNSPTEDEISTLIEPLLVRISGDFSGCDDPRVVFGNRNATIWQKSDDAIDVLTPVGPVRGGPVDVQVACRLVDEDGNDVEGISTVHNAYDYFLGAFRDGEPNRDDIPDRCQDADGNALPGITSRTDCMFKNEFGSFTLFYQAEPFASLPDATGYGYFFSENSPRASMFWGQNADLVYGGHAVADDPTQVLPQIPQLNYETPEQGDRLQAGEGITFFFERSYSEALDPVRIAAIKRLNPDTGSPEPDMAQTPNNIGVWLRLEVESGDGGTQERYLRVGQEIGAWCNNASNAGCGGDDDALLDNTRLAIDPSFRLVFPQRPSREHLEILYPGIAPEYLAWLDCADDETCESAVGVMLPSGVYRNVQVIKAADEAGEWPWQDDEGRQTFRVLMEVIPEVTVTQGARFVDLPAAVSTTWPYDTDQERYDNFDQPLGEGGFPMDRPIFVSYPGGFSQGERIPPKNYDPARVADGLPGFDYPRDEDGRFLPDPASAAYDAYPYIEIPQIEIDTLLFANGGAFAQHGFPVQVQRDDESFDWRVPLPGGAANGAELTGADRWDDTYFVVALTVRQIEGPGGFGGGPWKASAFAWPGDDYITIPYQTMATVPTIADAFRPEGETQNGAELLGFASLEIHRLARWNLSTPEQLAAGIGFRDESAQVMFDVNGISIGYWHTENSCVDEIDNDGDGQIDDGDTNCARADSVYESGECQDGEDNDEDGFVDAADPDCTNAAGTYDPTDIDEGSACSDGVDNDGDGWTDWRDLNQDGIPDPGSDPGCADGSSSSEGGFDSSFDCNDGIDSDFDGLIDSDDPGCESADDLSEAGDTCSDGIDNNGDGWIDSDDLMCRPGRNSTAAAFLFGTRGETDYDWVAAVNFLCSNMDVGGGALRDDDQDGLANAADPDCGYGWDPTGEANPPGECTDRSDNDGDGWIDDVDPDCLTAQHPEAGGFVGGTCNNGLDDDGDGWIDAQDPVCRDGADNETIVAGTLQYSTLACNNNVDDDGDGDVDSDDVDCVSGKDNAEE